MNNTVIEMKEAKEPFSYVGWRENFHGGYGMIKIVFVNLSRGRIALGQHLNRREPIILYFQIKTFDEFVLHTMTHDRTFGMRRNMPPPIQMYTLTSLLRSKALQANRQNRLRGTTDIR